MRVNFSKTIVEKIDEAIKGRAVESVELNTEERHQLYKAGSSRFIKGNRSYMPAFRGRFMTTSGKWIEVLAEEEC